MIRVENLQASLTYTYYNSHFRDFKVYLFDQIATSILTTKDRVEEEKKNLVMSSGVEIVWDT